MTSPLAAAGHSIRRWFLSRNGLRLERRSGLECGFCLTTRVKETSFLPPLRPKDEDNDLDAKKSSKSFGFSLQDLQPFAHSKLSRPSLLSSSLSYPLYTTHTPPGDGAALLRPVDAALQAHLGERHAGLRERQTERGKVRRRRRRGRRVFFRSSTRRTTMSNLTLPLSLHRSHAPPHPPPPLSGSRLLPQRGRPAPRLARRARRRP